MRSNNEHRNLEDKSYRELRLLEEVDRTPDLSQRRLSSRLGIAVGITNILIKSLVKKGHIRVVRVKWRRWVYILTPAGIARKVQLTISYTERFLDHYRRVRELLRRDLGALTLGPDAKIAIYGTAELAELVFLVLQDMGVVNIDIFDSAPSDSKFLGMPVRSPEDMQREGYVKVIVADPTDANNRRQELLRIGIDESQIVTLLQEAQPASDLELRTEG